MRARLVLQILDLKLTLVVEISNVRRILSFDGGGVRGLASLIILRGIMDNIHEEQIKHGATKSTPPRPCEYFDLICGTSTGGLIAIMLGRLGMVFDPPK